MRSTYKLSPDSTAKKEVAIVRYLNAMPLVWGLLHGRQTESFDALLKTPAECADQLLSGGVEIALIPSIEFQRLPGCRIVKGAAVAAVDQVRSVIVICRKRPEDVMSIGCDTTSRTSVALTRIIFKELYGACPALQKMSADVDGMLASCDAALVIGDYALKYMEDREHAGAGLAGSDRLHVLDLAERWKTLTGLPFVFAFWAVRQELQGRDALQAARTLNESRDFGVANRSAIADIYSETLRIPVDSIRRYLEHNVHYYMDDSCVEALRVFYDKAAKAGATAAARALDFI